jgi:CBS domain-containing protein
MKSVALLLKSKADPSSVWSTSPTDSVFNAVTLMAQKNVGALLVLEQGAVVGILTERGCVRNMLLGERAPRNTLVREVMSAPVRYVQPHHTNEDCMALMTDKRLRHLPVMQDGKLLGLLSIGDLVKDIISEQNFIIQQLEHYIVGERG